LAQAWHLVSLASFVAASNPQLPEVPHSTLLFALSKERVFLLDSRMGCRSREAITPIVPESNAGAFFCPSCSCLEEIEDQNRFPTGLWTLGWQFWASSLACEVRSKISEQALISKLRFPYD
jgi:hypothetical protein